MLWKREKRQGEGRGLDGKRKRHTTLLSHQRGMRRHFPSPLGEWKLLSPGSGEYYAGRVGSGTRRHCDPFPHPRKPGALNLLPCSSDHPPEKHFGPVNSAPWGLATAFRNDLGEIRSFLCAVVSSPTCLPERNDEALCSREEMMAEFKGTSMREPPARPAGGQEGCTGPHRD